MSNQLPDASLAEIAVELRLAHVDWAEISFALWFQGLCAGDRQRRLELLTAKIGLPVELSERIIAGEYRHTEAIARAHDIFKQLIPHEAEVARLLAGLAPAPPCNDNKPAWRRAMHFLFGSARGR